MWLAAELAAFARVVELGSFTAAARALGVPKVALSRAVKALEARSGSRLLERTTRRIALTDAGRALLPWCERIAAEADSARRAMHQQSGIRTGLRVLADAAWGRLLLTPLVPRFLERYPAIPLEVELLANLPTRAAPDWDVLIQAGRPGADLVISALGAPPLILCATPAWLAAHGTPKRAVDLPRDALLIAGTATDQLRLRRAEETIVLPVAPRLAINDPAVVHAAMAAGMGIGVLPEFLCRQGLAMGRLVHVLPDWLAADVIELYAACDLARAARAEVRALVDFLVAHMVPVLRAAGGQR
ncbi:MAG: LysR family transcriptional regulator [Gammaproteobacteria bacterium]|nr:LysR family transcriptional regulator [Gammaproteobacteria bacterium]